MQRKARWLPGYAALLQASVVLIACFAIARVLPPLNGEHIRAILRKATGKEEACEWRALLQTPWSLARFAQKKVEYAKAITPLESDAGLGIERFSTRTRPFWIRKSGVVMNGRGLLAYILAEEDWLMAEASGHGVRPGDVVVDIGAHIGTFGDDALRRGAKKVIMVEPDPVNVECIRRNFSREIAAGTVVVVPEGAWSSEGTLDFIVGISNSGTGAFVDPEKGGADLKVRVRPLDDMLRELGAGRVDFIKMDIEGAEREALKGAAATLGRYKPRLMIDAYHRVDDPVVLPRVIAQGNAAYRQYCVACTADHNGLKGQFAPYADFYE